MSKVTANQVVDPAVLMRRLNEWADGAQPRLRGPQDRFAISSAFELIPLDEAGAPLQSEALLVFGKDLSRRGIAFSHSEPLRYRRAVISFNHANVGCFTAEVEIAWSQLTPIGLYESGCRLIRKMPTCKVRCKA